VKIFVFQNNWQVRYTMPLLAVKEQQKPSTIMGRVSWGRYCQCHLKGGTVHWDSAATVNYQESAPGGFGTLTLVSVHSTQFYYKMSNYSRTSRIQAARHHTCRVLPPFHSTCPGEFFEGFSSGVFSVISLYGAVYFVRLGEAGEFYLEVFLRFLNVLYIY
jgi:hypothetical protein